MEKIKNNFFVRILIFILFYLFIKELIYWLIEDYFIVRFRFHSLKQGLYSEISIVVFALIQIFVYYLFTNIYKSVKLLWRLILFVIASIIAFYSNSMIFYIFSEEYTYSYFVFFLIGWCVLFIISYWLFFELYKRLNTQKIRRQKKTKY